MIYYNNTAFMDGIWLSHHPSTIVYKKERGWDKVHALGRESLHNLSLRIDDKPTILAKYFSIVKKVRCKVEKNTINVSCIPTEYNICVSLFKEIERHCECKIKVSPSVFIIRTSDGYVGMNPMKSVMGYRQEKINSQGITNVKTKKLTKKMERQMVSTYKDKNGVTWCGFLPKWRVDDDIVYMV